jgi:hypothetical protein
MIDQIRGVPIRVAPHMAYLQVGAWVLEVKTSLQTARELACGSRNYALHRAHAAPRGGGAQFIRVCDG